MISRIKTVILLLLVSLSLFLTYQLWYGQKPAELTVDDVFEDIDYDEPRVLQDAIVPERIVFEDEGYYYIFSEGRSGFSTLWNNLSVLLQDIDGNFSEQHERLVDSGNNEEEENPVLVLTIIFRPPLPAGEKGPWLMNYNREAVTRIDFYCLHDSCWMVVHEAETGIKAAMDLNNRMKNRIIGIQRRIPIHNEIAHIQLDRLLLSDIFDRDIEIRSPIFVPVEDHSMRGIYLKAEEYDRDKLLKTFFVDYSLARVIEERDGGIIYTDGEKGLRLKPYGFEYSHPGLEEAQASSPYNDALQRSNALISFHGGWPKSLRLERLVFSGRARTFYYIAEWKTYYDGYPLYSGRPTRALFNDLGLFHFYRSLYYYDGEIYNEEGSDHNGIENETIASWSEALQKAISIFSDWLPGLDIRLRLEAMNLGYAVTGLENAPRGRPVWFVRINGEEVLMDAYTLQVIRRDELL